MTTLGSSTDTPTPAEPPDEARTSTGEAPVSLSANEGVGDGEDFDRRLELFDLRPLVVGIVNKNCGFVRDTQSALNVIARFERATSTKYAKLTAPTNFNSGEPSRRLYKIMWRLLEGKKEVIPSDCIPFLHLGTMVLELANADGEEKEGGSTTKSSRIANITLYEVVKFPGFRIEADTEYCRHSMGEALTKQLQTEFIMPQEKRIYLVLPTPASTAKGLVPDRTEPAPNATDVSETEAEYEPDYQPSPLTIAREVEVNSTLPRDWNEMWTPLSDDNLRGWVPTKAMAEAVRKSFEKKTGIRFISERKRNTFGRFREDINTLDFNKLRIRFNDLRQLVVPYDGVPFVIVGSCCLTCMFGKDRHIAKKERTRELREKEGKKCRNRKYCSPKQGCPARIYMKEVVRFIDYKRHKRSQKDTSYKLRDDFRSGVKLKIESRIYIRLPSEQEHMNPHPSTGQGRSKKRRIMDGVSLETIEEAAERVRGQIHLTPVMTCGMIDDMAVGRKLFFKCELLQKTGSFKIRGALNAVKKLIEHETSDNQELKVVTDSSGNFGQALAYAARLNRLEAYVVMPSNAPLCKRNAVLGYGASVAESEPTEQSRKKLSQTIAKETGAHFFSPSQSLDVIAGQGTIGLELLEQIPDLDAVIVPVGGGGMTAGITTAIKSKKPSIKVYAAEPCNADDCFQSFHSKKRIPLPPGPVDTVADGLRVSIGKNTWPIIAKHVDGVFTVTEEEIKKATRLVWQFMKLFIEPSAGVAVAVALSEDFSMLPPEIKNVAVILSGGNVDLESVKDWI